jgi:hypothetical protein
MKRKLLLVLCILFGITGIAAAAGAWWYHHNFRAAPFTPVRLSTAEQKVLDEKISARAPAAAQPQPAPSPPEKTIVLTEREINGWLQQQGLGETVKVTLAGGAIAASALMPLDNDVPFIGGRTVRFKIALRPQIDAKNRLGLFVSDVTVGGISPPNAWLGGIKGRNLLDDAPSDPAATAFAQGIKSLDIGSGEIRVVLND